MQPEQLKSYRQRLLQLRQATERSLADLQQGLGQELRDSIVELSSYDNHPADIATETFERGKDLALREVQANLLQAVDSALDRIDDGSFGYCTVCGRGIPEERLQAVPYATSCVQCQRAQEDATRPRPIEESLVNQMLRESFKDNDPKDSIGFDGEDSWQAVARYGTSNTPGDFRQVENYDDAYIDSDEEIGIFFEEDKLPDPEAGRQVGFSTRPRQEG